MTKRRFTASVWREDRWFVAQCLETDVASQGRTEQMALKNLAEAIELHLLPTATRVPSVRSIDVTVRAA
jgi:hypothetical protein